MYRFAKASLTMVLYIHMLDSSWGDYSQSIFVLVVLCLPHALHNITSLFTLSKDVEHWESDASLQCE